jgi:photosystem II stability/assembly factor-like uncharacterized protein
MPFFSRVKIRQLAGIVLIAGVWVLTQPALTGLPNQVKSAVKSQKTETKFKAIWEPVNVKEDIELESIHFVTPEEGWVAGGRTNMQGGVILHTADAGANWEVQLGDPQSSDRAYHDVRFATPRWDGLCKPPESVTINCSVSTEKNGRMSALFPNTVAITASFQNS